MLPFILSPFTDFLSTFSHTWELDNQHRPGNRPLFSLIGGGGWRGAGGCLAFCNSAPFFRWRQLSSQGGLTVAGCV